jgi:hypothetical protein
MSLSLTVTVIVLADLALLGLLAFVMSRAALLTPHARRSERPQAIAAPRTAAPQWRQVRRERATATSRS